MDFLSIQLLDAAVCAPTRRNLNYRLVYMKIAVSFLFSFNLFNPESFGDCWHF